MARFPPLSPAAASPWARPVGVPSAITVPELLVLQHYAAQAGGVLEVGTLYGYSAIGMALAGATVLTVDPHTGGPADRPDTWAEFNAHVDRHRPLPAGIWPVRAGFEEWVMSALAQHEPEIFGMAFLDGDHGYGPTYLAGAFAAQLLAPAPAPRLLAFHDVILPNWPGVVRAVGRLRGELGLELLRREGCLEVYRVP